MEEAFKKQFAAKDQKDRVAFQQAKQEVQRVKVERAKVRTKIKEATNANSLYHRAAKPWLDAKKLLIQEENYKHYDEIAAMYEEAKARADAQRAKEDADDAARVAQKRQIKSWRAQPKA